MHTLLAYPGGKTRLRPFILATLDRFRRVQYREPFFGGGSIGLEMMNRSDRDIWINDKDIGINCLWQAVERFPQHLKALIRGFAPSREQFQKLKTFLLSNPDPFTDEDVLRIGFCKLACHRLSFSGLGVMAGSCPRGFRWNPAYLCEQTDKLHRDFIGANVRITRADYSELITDESVEALLYMDPPYVLRGPGCYLHSFRDEDHVRLSELLRRTPHRWLLSYDDSDMIQKLYRGWSNIARIPAGHSIRNRTKQNELLISSGS
jgi:DNA adenine methylase